EAGIERGDVISTVGGRPIHSVEEYDQRVRDHTERSEIDMTVIRGGTSRSVTVHARPFPMERSESLAWQLIGVRIAASEGPLRVTRVRADSPAARIGIEPGDTIVALAGARVKTEDEFRRKMVEVRLAQSVLLSIRRGPYLYQVPVPFDAAA